MHLVFDTETTGFPRWNSPFNDPNQARVCQIACILVDDEWNEVGSFCSLIKPDNWIISQGAFGAHGISIESCDKYGIPSKAAIGVIISFLAQADYIVCHGARFDSYMLDVELQHAGADRYDIEGQSICTMRASRKICEERNIKKKGPGLNLQELFKECFGEVFPHAHDAMFDVRATAACFKWLHEHGHVELPDIIA